MADPVTISADQLALYQRGLALLNKLETDPRSKGLIEAAVKIHHPEVVTEAETVERQVTPLLKPVQDTLDKLNARMEKEDADRTAAAQVQVERSIDDRFAHYAKQGYTEDGIAKIKQLMLDKGVGDVDAAVAYFDKLNPAPTSDVSSYTPQTWDLAAGHGAGGDTKLLFSDPDAWTEAQIPLVLNDIRSGR